MTSLNDYGKPAGNIVDLRKYIERALDQFGRAQVIRTMHDIMVDRAKLEHADTVEEPKRMG